jgi:hypothetical protein
MWLSVARRFGAAESGRSLRIGVEAFGEGLEERLARI